MDKRNDENTLIVYDGGTATAYAAALWELNDMLGDETLCEFDFHAYLPMVIGGKRLNDRRKPDSLGGIIFAPETLPWSSRGLNGRIEYGIIEVAKCS